MEGIVLLVVVLLPKDGSNTVKIEPPPALSLGGLGVAIVDSVASEQAHLLLQLQQSNERCHAQAMKLL